MSHASGLEESGGIATVGIRDPLPRSRIVHCLGDDLNPQTYFAYVPGSAGCDAPLLVVVHGLARNARELAAVFASHCEAHGVVLVAPLFGESCADYQRLGRSGRGPRADAVLEGIVDEVVLRAGAAAPPFHLFGHSGGAQFAHRYAMAHPHRVARAVMASAGWYTFPKRRRRFPHGIKRSRRLTDVRFDPDEFLRVPMTVLVGESDTGKDNLRRDDRVNRQQGLTRLERGRNWVDAMRAAAADRGLDPLVRFESLPGAGNGLAGLADHGRLCERVFAALFDVEAPEPSRSVANGGPPA